MTTIVIGGGWSGLAAAIKLCQRGETVHLFESAKQLGGRARNVQWQDKTVDNGQHLMIGAYTEMLALMASIDIDATQVLDRQTIDISIIDDVFPALQLSATNALPWPLSLAWSLLKSTGISGLLHIKKLQSSIVKLRKAEDISVTKWLANTQQPERLIKQLWEPLCLATLNTPIAEASAHLLAQVIDDSLGKGKKSADLLIPKLALGDVFPATAAKFLTSNGAQIYLQTRVSELVVADNKINGVTTQDGQSFLADNVIIATAPHHCASLVANYAAITLPQSHPIITVYLQYPEQCRLPSAMQGMTGSISQWIFDRSQQHPGLMAVVISGPGKHQKMTNNELINHVRVEVSQYFYSLPEQPQTSLVIREKRAGFAATVGIEKNRPSVKTKIDGLWLAGDYCANGYPATLEGAIINGTSCARAILSY
ncbi:hypothetical protein A9Q78_08960 [Methylophaga sp. 41_12_T18]|nr:hypothetical protein A9Q78_08960 [Methylophaga sp. 41_12_T18]